MPYDGMVSTLAAQMVEAKAKAVEAHAKGRDARLIIAIDRSLRRTLKCYVQIRDPRQVASREFSLWVEPTGEMQVRHGEQGLPVSGTYLQSLLREAGVEPTPGQVILLDEGLVAALVEEALGAVSQEEARIRDVKTRLIRASLEADSKGKSGLPPAGHRSPGAA